MGETVTERVAKLLESVQEEVEDPELSFKLRTARQMLVLCSEQHAVAKQALDEADLDEKTRDNLRQLGYLD